VEVRGTRPLLYRWPIASGISRTYTAMHRTYLRSFFIYRRTAVPGNLLFAPGRGITMESSGAEGRIRESERRKGASSLAILC